MAITRWDNGGPITTATWDPSTGWPVRPPALSVIWFGPQQADVPPNMADNDGWFVVRDLIPPGQPTGLGASSGDARASTLTWNRNGDADLDHYTVYMSSDGGTTYVPLAVHVAQPALPATTVSQTIGRAGDGTTLVDTTTYWFKVQAVDHSGNTSPLSTAVSATPIDVTPPAAPSSASPYAVPGSNDITVYWATSVALDLDHEDYRFSDRADGGTSSTSLAIATGAATFTVSASGLPFAVGATVRAWSAANSANFMEGTVTSYSGTTLVVNVTATGGSGTHADWNVVLWQPWVSLGPDFAPPITISGLQLGHTYDIEIRAVDPDGNVSTSLSGGGYSNVTTVVVVPAIQTWLAALDPTKVVGRFWAGEAKSSGGVAWADGQTVTSLKDASTAGHNLAGGAAAPIFRAAHGSLNGRPVLDFASSARLSAAGWTPIPQPFTVFLVARQGATGQMAFTDGGDDAATHRANIAATNTGIYVIRNTNAAGMGGIGADTHVHAFAAVFNGGTSKLFQTPGKKVGDPGAPYTGAPIGAQTLRGLTLGGLAGAISNQLTGQIALVVVYAGDATADGSTVADFFTDAIADYAISPT